MNNIIITHELCAEDRARLDRLTAALEALQPPTMHVELPTFKRVDNESDPDQLTLDDIQQKLAETLAKTNDHAEPSKNAPGATEDETPSTTHVEEEKPTHEEDDLPEQTVEPTVTLEQIQQKVVQLAAGNNGAKKAKVREIVNAYAKKVSDLPEDKWSEIWSRLTDLEKED